VSGKAKTKLRRRSAPEEAPEEAPTEQVEDPSRRLEQLEHEATQTREQLATLVAELDRRRHRTTPLAIAGAAVAGIAVVGGVIWRHLRRR
jgi:hypothetical protein